MRAACVVFAVLFLMLVSRITTAQTLLRGHIVTVVGTPIEDAQVDLLADSVRPPTVLSRAKSDGAGNFVLTAPSPGPFYLQVRRLGYAALLRSIELHSGGADSVVIRLEDFQTVARLRDSILEVQHWQRVAIARKRARRWVCGDSPEATRGAADSAYARFARAAGMRDILDAYGMPHERDSFLRAFTRPLTPRECAAFAEGMDQRYGLETDTIRVFRFGTSFFLPDFGDGGAFADSAGRLVVMLIVAS